MFNAKILADSTKISNFDYAGIISRLITAQLTFPRIVLAEFNTHRKFSRNAASSRAIPITKMIKDVQENPFVPIHWGKNQKGMQANEVLGSDDSAACEMDWMLHRDESINRVESMISHGLHKQIANRLLEPWMWVTVIATGDAGAWSNFFALRCHPDAEPHIQKVAYMARDIMDIGDNPMYISPKSNILKEGEWHLPLIGFPGDEFLSIEDKIKVSVGRCARVSYLTHDGIRDVQADIDLHDRLRQSKHFSPFEHVAQAIIYGDPNFKGQNGNFSKSWIQYRKTLSGEYQSNGRF